MMRLFGLRLPSTMTHGLALSALAEGTQQTRLTLIHRNLERFGEGADNLAASLDKGWSGFLRKFGEFAEKNAG